MPLPNRRNNNNPNRRPLLYWLLCVLIVYFFYCFLSYGVTKDKPPLLINRDNFLQAMPKQIAAKKRSSDAKGKTDGLGSLDPSYQHCTLDNPIDKTSYCYASTLEQKTPCFSTSSQHKYCVPYAVVFGWPKTGTSALFHKLSVHPDIQLALDGRKEMDYFSHWRPMKETNFLTYLSWFPSEVDEEKVMIEASSEYATSVEAPSAMKAFMPHVKLIAVLRDPVKQIYSYHAMKQQLSTFEATVDSNVPSRCNTTCAEHWSSSCSLGSSCRFLGRAVYVDWIEHWLNYFPPEQIMLIRSEDLRQTPLEVMRAVEGFLSLRPNDYGTALTSLVNVGGKSDIYAVHNSKQSGGLPEIPEKARRTLEAFFKPHNERLKQLTKREWWSYD